MKAIFEFNLPEETSDFNIYRSAENMKAALKELQTWLRHQRKYAEKKATIEEAELEFYEILRENGIDLEELV